jgi:hypothetical protein
MQKKILFLAFILLLPNGLAITCDFSGWNVPMLSPDNTITLDGDLWQAHDQNLGTVYSREIIKVGTESEPIIVDNELTPQDYLDIANDFLERNEDTLNIGTYSALEYANDGGYPIVKFLGENQICYGYYVVGSFAGAIKFTENRVYSILSKWYKPVDISDGNPSIDSGAAAGAASGGGGGGGGGGKSSPKLAILPLANDSFRLVWDVNLENETHVYVDAHTGEILEKDSRIPANQVMKSPPTVNPNNKIIFAATLSFIIIIASVFIWMLTHRPRKK